MTSSGIQSNLQSTKFSNEHLDLFFTRMKSIYPTLWLSSITTKKELDLIREEWFSVLKKLSFEEIKYGIDQCKLYEDFPPSIAKFVKRALNIKDYDEVSCNDPLYKQAQITDSWSRGHMTTKEMDKSQRIAYKTIVSDYLHERLTAFDNEEDDNLLEHDEQETELLEYEVNSNG